MKPWYLSLSKSDQRTVTVLNERTANRAGTTRSTIDPPITRPPITRRAILLPLALAPVALAPLAIAAGPARAAGRPPPAVERLAGKHGIPVTDVAGLIFDPDGGGTIEDWQADRPFTPASVAKLATVTAALAVLGTGHRFTTEVLATGPLRDGLVAGDVILRGGGDPLLATQDLRELAGTLARRGVRGATGRFLYDTSALPELPEIDPAQPFVAGYNPGVGALSLNFNRVEIALDTATGPGAAEQAWTVAEGGRYPVDSVRLVTGGATGRAVLPLGAIGDDSWRLPRSSFPGEVLTLPVARPGLAAASVFRRIAADSGVNLPPPAAGAPGPVAASLARHDSAPLTEIGAAVLRWSNNLAAELVGLATGRALAPGAASLAATAGAIGRWLAAAAPHTDWTGLHLANHSGLSSRSVMTARQIAAILTLGGSGLWGLLPGGEDGRTKRPVRAKSGTIAYARGLAGLLPAASGRTVGFVVLIGNPAQRATLDAAMDRSTTVLPAPARDWLARSRSLQTDLVMDWIGRL